MDVYELTIRQGRKQNFGFKLENVLKDVNTGLPIAVDFTGYTAKLVFKPFVDSTEVLKEHTLSTILNWNYSEQVIYIDGVILEEDDAFFLYAAWEIIVIDEDENEFTVAVGNSTTIQPVA